MKRVFNALILYILLKESKAIIGYDCSQRVSNLTTFSLIQVGECDIPEPQINTTKVYVRLLQLNEFKSVQVRMCKVEIKRSVKYCGAFSHTKEKFRGEVQYMAEVSAEECRKMHFLNTYIIRGEIISSIKGNSTTVHPMTFVGQVESDGSCKGATTYTDPYGTYDESVVTGYVKITIQDYYTPVNLNTNEIILRSGTRCHLNQENCIDVEAGYVFWDAAPTKNCGEHKYSQLYSGSLNKIVENENVNRAVYVLESNEITFAFTATGTTPVCGFDLVRTEHPKLFIIEGLEAHRFTFTEAPSVHNLDIFTYVNSKFIYVEKHIKGELKRLYRDLLVQKCELEKRVVANALSIAVTQPDVFAQQIMKTNGYVGLVAGEVVHIMKCIQVDVTRRNTEACYQELPVTKDGKEYFLSPRTHILKQYGTETTCNPVIPPMYLLGEEWFTVLPHSTIRGIEPMILKPMTKHRWNYTEPGDLAKSGIYTLEEIETLRQHVMFPVERPAMLNTIALSMSGRSTHKNGLSATRLFDEEALTKLAESTWAKIWSKFMTFGSLSAAVIGMFMIGRLIKLLADTIIHGYALYSLYGWSIHILGSVWNSVTQLLLHLGHSAQRRAEQKKHDLEKEYGSAPAVHLQGGQMIKTRPTVVTLDESKNTVINKTITEDGMYPNLDPLNIPLNNQNMNK